MQCGVFTPIMLTAMKHDAIQVFFYLSPFIMRPHSTNYDNFWLLF